MHIAAISPVKHSKCYISLVRMKVLILQTSYSLYARSSLKLPLLLTSSKSILTRIQHQLERAFEYPSERCIELIDDISNMNLIISISRMLRSLETYVLGALVRTKSRSTALFPPLNSSRLYKVFLRSATCLIGKLR